MTPIDLFLYVLAVAAGLAVGLVLIGIAFLLAIGIAGFIMGDRAK